MKKICTLFLAFTIIFSSIVPVFGVNIDAEKTSRKVYVHAQGENPQGTSGVHEVYNGDNVDVCFAVDKANKGIGANEEQYNMNGYTVRFYYDPMYFDLNTNETVKLNYKFPFNNQYDDVANGGQSQTENTEGLYVFKHGFETKQFEGKIYQSAYITMLLQGITYPNSTKEWQNLCKLPLKAKKEGTSEVFIELYDYSENGYGLELLAKNKTDYPVKFNFTTVNNGSVMLNIKNKSKPLPPTPNVLQGNYTSVQKVKLSTTETGDSIKIFYSTNPNAPSTVGNNDYTEYTDGDEITVSNTTTIKCYVQRIVSGITTYSNIVSYTYNIVPMPPSFFLKEGDMYLQASNDYSVSNPFTIYVSDSQTYEKITDTKEVYYTFSNIDSSKIEEATTNSDPYTKWVKVSKSAPYFVVDKNISVKAVTATIGSNGEIDQISNETFYYFTIAPKPAIPSIVPNGTYYDKPIAITLSCETTNAQIYYTLDGSDPRTNGVLYETENINLPVSISQTVTLRTVAKYENSYSVLNSYNYIFANPVPLTVYAFRSPGVYDESVNVSLYTSSLDNTIYYTLDGSEPTESSFVFDSKNTLKIVDNTIIKAFAKSKDNQKGTVTTFEYKIKPKKPILSPASTQFENSGNVYILSPVADDKINLYYTLDGTNPITSATRSKVNGISGNLTINSYTKISAICEKQGVYSDVVYGYYDVVKNRPKKPAVTLIPGNYTLLNLSSTTFKTKFLSIKPEYQIYYTVGYKVPPADPTLTGATTKMYHGEDIEIKGQTIIKAFSIDKNGKKSDVAIFSYNVSPQTPVIPNSSFVNKLDMLRVETVPNSTATYKIDVQDVNIENTILTPSNGIFYIDAKNGDAYEDMQRNNKILVTNTYTYIEQMGDNFKLSVSTSQDEVKSLEIREVYIINTVNVAPPFANYISGVYNDTDALKVKLNTIEKNGQIYYRTSSDADYMLYNENTPVLITNDSKLYAYTKKEDKLSSVSCYIYSFRPLSPVISPVSGTYPGACDVKIDYDENTPADKQNYKIYYRRNNDTKYYLYTGTDITVEHSGSISAYVVKNNGQDNEFKSEISTNHYIIDANLKTPITDLSTTDNYGQPIYYGKGQIVRFDDYYKDDDTINLIYTTDGSSPTDTANKNRKTYKDGDATTYITLNSEITIQAVYEKEYSNGNDKSYAYGNIGVFVYYINTSTNSGGGGGGGGGSSSKTQQPIYTKDIFGSEKPMHIKYLFGYKDGTVNANGYITREEAATIIYRVMAENYLKPRTIKGDVFLDMPANRWSTSAVEALTEFEIISGYPDGEFKPNKYITRAEMCTMLCRYVKLTQMLGKTSFPDIEKHWAIGYINAINDKKLIQGYKDGTFKPNNNITRAETVTIINKICGRAPVLSYLLSQTFNPFSDLDKDKWYYADILEATITHAYKLDKNIKEINWIIVE